MSVMGKPLYIDFHAHHEALEDERVVRDGVDTWGIHPWHAATFFQSGSAALSEPLCLSGEMPVLIGECGLDKCCDTPFDIQLRAFEHCVSVSERLALPLVLHCVRAMDECLAMRHRLGARQPWVWHGFRGKPQQLRQLLAHGFYFSFGPLYNKESLQACPPDRLLLETDAQQMPVRRVYECVAADLGLSLEDLCQRVADNVAVLLQGK